MIRKILLIIQISSVPMCSNFTTMTKYNVSYLLSLNITFTYIPLKLKSLFSELYNQFLSLDSDYFPYFSPQTIPQYKHSFNQTALQATIKVILFFILIFMPLNLWISKNICGFLRQNLDYFKDINLKTSHFYPWQDKFSSFSWLQYMVKSPL